MTDTRKTPRGAFAIVFSIVLMNSIGFGIIVPVMPALIMDVADVDLAEAALLGGVLSVSYAIMQVFFAPVLGNLADAYGRKRVLLVSVFTFGIDFLVMAMAPVFAWLVVGRLIAGIASSTNSVANAYVADISPPEERAGNYGLMGAAFGVGFIVGPVIGGLLAEFGARAPFLGAAVLGFANALFVFLCLRESLGESDRRPFRFVRANPVGALRQFRGSTVVMALLFVTFVVAVAHFVLPATWSFYTIERFAWSPQQIGYSLALVGIMMVIVQGGLTPWIVPRWGVPKSALVGLVFAILGYVGYAVSPLGWMMFVVIVPHALSGLSMPAMQSMMTERVSADSQGELQGAIGSANSMAAVLGPPLMTVLFGVFSDRDAFFYLPGAAFFMAATLTLVGCMVLLRVTAAGSTQE